MSTYVCMDCYETYKPGTLNLNNPRTQTEMGEPRCPRTVCGGVVAELDELIAPAIVTLNLKGYITSNCCSGHWYDEHVSPYIMFGDVAFLPESLPQGWEVGQGHASQSIYYREEDMSALTDNQKLLKLMEIHKDLLNWAESLEGITEWE